MLKKLLFFLLLNFLALGIGSFFTADGVASMWYQNLHKAPWTPPGWVFGFMWTSIMILFSLYLADLSSKKQFAGTNRLLYLIQWLLNVLWNPVFFYFHWTFVGLLIISGLLITVLIVLQRNRVIMGWKSILVFPYALWLLIATSLNAYILFYN